MATTFVSATTGEFGFVRFFSGTETGSRGTCLEFVTHTNRSRVVQAAVAGETFVSEFGEVLTVGDLLEFEVTERATVGVMAATVSLGEAMDL